jgi:cell division septum initiation protein DivIVA
MAGWPTSVQIRNAELPRARRGYEEEATRRLLSDAARALDQATSERDELRKQIEQLTRTVEEKSTDAETIGAVLMTAQGVADDLVAKATAEASEIRERAQLERDELLVEARGEAEANAAQATAGLESLRAEDEAMRRSISARRQELAGFLRGALAQLDALEGLAPPELELDGALLDRLPSD